MEYLQLTMSKVHKTGHQDKSMAELIMEKIDHIQKELNEVREYIEDMELSEDDIKALQEGLEEHRKGQTISLERLEKECSE